MDFYLKELPDSTVTLMTSHGQIIGKFDSVDEAEDLFFDQSYPEQAVHDLPDTALE